MPAAALRERLGDALTAFAWDEWAQMGVFAPARRASPWAQDPEALLVFTFEIARDDPRLFDEVLDWLVLNESLVSTRRLQAMCRDSLDSDLIGAVLAWVKTQQGRGRASEGELITGHDARASVQPLFHQLRAPVREVDAAFSAHGFIRPPVALARKSQRPDLGSPINLAFRLRELLGLSARAEVVRCMLTLGEPWTTANVVARFAGYAKRNVQEALGSLVAAEVVSRITVGAEQRYSIDHARWSAFLQLDVLPQLRDWPEMPGILRRVLRWLRDERLDSLSDYLRASHARDLLEELRPELASAGIPIRLGRAPETAWDALETVVEVGLRTLADGDQSDPRLSWRDKDARSRRDGIILVLEGDPGRYAWSMFAANGHLVAASVDEYRSATSAQRAARNFRDQARDLRYEVYDDGPDVYRWRARASNGSVLAESPNAFSARSNAKRAAERVREIAPHAVIE